VLCKCRKFNDAREAEKKDARRKTRRAILAREASVGELENFSSRKRLLHKFEMEDTRARKREREKERESKHGELYARRSSVRFISTLERRSLARDPRREYRFSAPRA